eukprot:3831991-Rhodomonas_salina.1
MVLKYGGKEAKTTTKKGVLDAEWNERFLLNLITSKEGADLEVRCMDHDIGQKDDFVGKCLVPASDLQNLAMEGTAEMEVLLNMHIRDIHGKEDEFKADLRVDMARAMGGHPELIRVVGVHAGSIIARVALDPGASKDGRAFGEVIKDLQHQCKDESSVLKQGKYTQRVKDIKEIRVGTEPVEPFRKSLNLLAETGNKAVIGKDGQVAVLEL